MTKAGPDPSPEALTGISAGPRSGDPGPLASPRLGKGWRIARWSEMLLIFVAGPILLVKVGKPALLFPAIWTLAGLSLALLLLDKTFDRRRLWNARLVKLELPRIALRFAVCAPLLTVALLLLDPDRLLQLPRRNPTLWAIIMIAYPVLSVYPQELAFRALFMHRYAPLFQQEWVLLAAGAALFGFAHIVMPSWWWSVGFSVIGGAFFGLTYRRSGSLLAACLEHALYGCFLFTIGWGWYFYSGSRR